MVKGVESILLSSPKARKLAMFYKDKVGLKLSEEFEYGEKGEEGFGFEMKNRSSLYITDHSKIKEKSKQPERYLLNFEVDDIEKEVVRMKKAKVKLVKDIYHVENYGLIATFEDIDGNYFQLVQVRES